jgi:hypothetical protein
MTVGSGVRISCAETIDAELIKKANRAKNVLIFLI